MKKTLLCLSMILCLLALCACTNTVEETTTLPPEVTTADPGAATTEGTTEPPVTEDPVYSFFEIFGGDEPADALLLIINEPDADTLSAVALKETMSVDYDNANLLLLPKYENSRITIDRVRYDSSSHFEVVEALYSNTATEADFALLVKTARPVGLPFLRITVEHEGQTGSYLVTYLGQDGTPSTEYICAA